MKGLPTLPASTDQGVKEGGAPSLVGDMHSLVALLWTMLSGKNYRDPPDYEEAPCYAHAELLEVLVQGRDSDDPDTLRVHVETVPRPDAKHPAAGTPGYDNPHGRATRLSG